MAENRNLWGDAAKGVGILLVLYGHMPYVPDRFADWIYAFHMPLFMVLSGYFWKARVDRSIPEMIRVEFRSLVKPYVLFWLLSWVFWLAKSHALGREIEWWRPVFGLLYGIDGASHWLENNAVLWFFPFLFVLRVSFALLWRLPGKVRLFSGLAGFLAGGLWIGLGDYPLPWSLDYALYAWPWFGWGILAKQRSWVPRQSMGYRALGVLLLAGLGVFASLDLFPRMVWNGGRLLPLWLFILGTMAGVVGVLWLRWPGFLEKSLAYLGRRTLWVFALHLPCYSLIAAAWSLLTRSPPSAEDPRYFVFQFFMPLLALVGILAVHPKLERA